jgi:hypothetical protein
MQMPFVFMEMWENEKELHIYLHGTLILSLRS